jgi:hypothetical protein
MGCKGRLEVWGGEPCAVGIVRDIEKGAKLTIIESETEGPRLVRYRPHPNAVARRQAQDANAE